MKKYKVFLKIWFVLYIIFTVVTLFNIDISSLFYKVVSGLNITFSSLTSIILFSYVGIKGNDKIAKFGILSFILCKVIFLLNTFGIVGISTFTASTFFERFIASLYNLLLHCSYLAEILALFYLINSDKINKYKSIVIKCMFFYMFINFFLNLGLVERLIFSNNLSIYYKFLMCINKALLILYSIIDVGKYAVIVFYLTDSAYAASSIPSSSSVVTNNVISNDNINQTHVNDVNSTKN